MAELLVSLALAVVIGAVVGVASAGLTRVWGWLRRKARAEADE